MMMAKPPAEEEEEETPKFAVKAAQVPPRRTPAETVADLERRLAVLESTPDSAPDLLGGEQEAKPAPPPAAAAAPAPTAAKSSGRTALLARIMAAQEKSKQAQASKPAQPAKSADLLMDLDAPNALETPPPAFDTNLLPPPAAASTAPPPAFDTDLLPPPATDFMAPPPIEAVAPPPPAMAQPSAPSFDLLDQFSAPPLENIQAVPPPPPPPVESTIDEDVLAALDPAEREALLEEQRQIMAEIEKKKAENAASGAAARAMAFDQRSNAAAARAAGREGLPPAYMSVVSPVDKDVAASAEAAEIAQMDADAKLAQQLQNEEYKKADRPRAKPKPAAATSNAGDTKDQSWYDWLTGSKPEAEKPAAASASRGSTSGSYRPSGGGLVSAQTGTEGAISHSNSYEERTPMVGYGGGGGGGGARMAQQKGMFSCVADSVYTAANAMAGNGADEEGNVHGVDSSSLLAMPQVSRQRE